MVSYCFKAENFHLARQALQTNQEQDEKTKKEEEQTAKGLGRAWAEKSWSWERISEESIRHKSELQASWNSLRECKKNVRKEDHRERLVCKKQKTSWAAKR